MLSPSKQKNRITEKLAKNGAAWAGPLEKFIGPNDEWGATPTYHVHPDHRHPHIDEVRRFHSLNDLEAWCDHMTQVLKDLEKPF